VPSAERRARRLHLRHAVHVPLPPRTLQEEAGGNRRESAASGAGTGPAHGAGTPAGAANPRGVPGEARVLLALLRQQHRLRLPGGAGGKGRPWRRPWILPVAVLRPAGGADTGRRAMRAVASDAPVTSAFVFDGHRDGATLKRMASCLASSVPTGGEGRPTHLVRFLSASGCALPVRPPVTSFGGPAKGGGG
ncbi:hypothetical protein CFC21_036573, partial [Triticum aestivum]